MADSGGPYIQAALVCERALQEGDGTVSVIRIIDRVFFVIGEDGQPVQRQQPITFVIMFKGGSARGSYTISLNREKPSGQQSPLIQAPVLFEGEDRGVNLLINAMFEPDEQGIYWFDVLFEGDLVTRIPLRAVYQQLPTVDRGE